MPMYEFSCLAGHVFHKLAPMKNPPSESCLCSCGREARRKWNSRVNVFKPYREDGFTGEPIEITSAKQRDELCKKHHLSYDSTRYFRKPRQKSAVEDLTLEDVMANIGKVDENS